MGNENATPNDLSASAETGPTNGTGTAPETEALPLPDIAELQRELEALKAKAAEHLDGWQRSQAEFQNYKRRVERERTEMMQGMTGKVIARYLDILDDFDRAMKGQPAEGEAGSPDWPKWAEGITLIYRKFQNVLDAEGVSRIEAEGKDFDPNLHEAVVHEESDGHTSGQIIEVLRHGYKLGDRVIRPALVKVAK
jgi:molecular chaperone GrpE